VPALATKVTPHPHLVYIWDAFGKLSTERQSGFGPGPIPVVSGIERYSRDHRIGHHDRFVTLVRRLDAAWLNYMNDRNKQPGKPAG
jgi:hypothetical protein